MKEEEKGKAIEEMHAILKKHVSDVDYATCCDYLKKHVNDIDDHAACYDHLEKHLGVGYEMYFKRY